MTQVSLNVLSGTGFPKNKKKTGDKYRIILGKHSILTMTNLQVFGAFCWSLRCRVLLLVIILSVSFYLTDQLRCSHSDIKHTRNKSFYNVWCKQGAALVFAWGRCVYKTDCFVPDKDCFLMNESMNYHSQFIISITK